ncbi:MAG: hypothetical protein RIT45_3331 [Pseudomonadota bacterium]|jgi:hypothetical protein
MSASPADTVDPALLQAFRMHRAALARGERTYLDPRTGFSVMTELVHRKRGFCCGSACRHCPYDWERVDNTRYDDADASRQRRREQLRTIAELLAEDDDAGGGSC